MPETKKVNLALQGGGAHGAFTWGALERLLDEDGLEIEGISGTSAGAMNAAMLKTGYLAGGRDGAKAQLEKFWRQVQDSVAKNINPIADWVAFFSDDAAKIARSIFSSPAYQAQETMSRTLSPYDWNPLNINPLREVLDGLIDFEACCRDCAPHLFISATNVKSGKIRVFRNADMSVNVLLASACLPNLYQAVEIAGEYYWDGGYMGNPALYPLFYHTESSDVVIVHVNPIERGEVPRTAAAIQNRVNEISFNSSLLRELRVVGFVKRLIQEGKIQTTEMKDVLIHSVRDDHTMSELNVATKLAPEPELFDHLRARGYAAANGFLTTHWNKIGTESSVDLDAMVD